MQEKICLACSAGGHLTELLQLEKAWQGKPHYFISDKRLNAIDLAKNEKVHAQKNEKIRQSLIFHLWYY